MKITKLENYNYENLEYFNSYALQSLQKQIIEFKNSTERKQKYKINKKITRKIIGESGVFSLTIFEYYYFENNEKHWK